MKNNIFALFLAALSVFTSQAFAYDPSYPIRIEVIASANHPQYEYLQPYQNHSNFDHGGSYVGAVISYRARDQDASTFSICGQYFGTGLQAYGPNSTFTLNGELWIRNTFYTTNTSNCQSGLFAFYSNAPVLQRLWDIVSFN